MPKRKLFELESDTKNTPTTVTAPDGRHFISIPAVPFMIDGNMREKNHDDKAWFINKGQGLFLLRSAPKGPPGLTLDDFFAVRVDWVNMSRERQ